VDVDDAYRRDVSNNQNLNKMWTKLNFLENPFKTEPLGVNAEGEELLIGRDSEGLEYETLVSSAKSGILIVAGDPGVGKTSFINVNQYMFEEYDKTETHLAARQLCPVNDSDSSQQIAVNCLSSLVNSVKLYCDTFSIKIPTETNKVFNWLNSKIQSTQGFSISILDIGGSIENSINLPSRSEISFDGVTNILQIVVQECSIQLNITKFHVVIDNIENLQQQKLLEILMSFRDTLFVQKNIWWTLIGKRQLPGIILENDSRIYERINGFIQLSPLNFEYLMVAIDERLKKYYSKNDANCSLISNAIYKILFDASNGEIRFIFKYCGDICSEFISSIKKNLLEAGVPRSKVDSKVDEKIKEFMSNNTLDDVLCKNLLKQIVKKELNASSISKDQMNILRNIGNNTLTSADANRLGLTNGFDFEEFINYYSTRRILHVIHSGGQIYFKLNGMISLAQYFKIL